MKWFKKGYNAIAKCLSKSKGKKANMLTNNTGVSIKSWLVYVTGITCIILLLPIPFVLLYDVLYDGAVETNINDIAAYVTAVGVVLISGVLPKTIGEFAEKRKDGGNKDDENGENR
jgi:hypothetical protein